MHNPKKITQSLLELRFYSDGSAQLYHQKFTADEGIAVGSVTLQAQTWEELLDLTETYTEQTLHDAADVAPTELPTEHRQLTLASCGCTVYENPRKVVRLCRAHQTIFN